MVLATRALSGKVADSSTGMDRSNPVLSGPGTDSAPGSTLSSSNKSTSSAKRGEALGNGISSSPVLTETLFSKDLDERDFVARRFGTGALTSGSVTSGAWSADCEST